jgi:inorganic pyrophosphatase
MKEDWQWKIIADAITRAANPTYYWFNSYDGTPRYLWDEIDVSEEEYRAHARPEDVAFREECLQDSDRDT